MLTVFLTFVIFHDIWLLFSRRQRNRDSAARYRRRQKELSQALEQRVADLEQQLARQQSAIDALQTDKTVCNEASIIVLLISFSLQVRPISLSIINTPGTLARSLAPARRAPSRHSCSTQSFALHLSPDLLDHIIIIIVVVYFCVVFRTRISHRFLGSTGASRRVEQCIVWRFVRG